MKFLLISGIYPPEIGGPATFIPSLARYLNSIGDEVRVVSLISGSTKRLHEAEGYEVRLISRRHNQIVRFVLTVFELIRAGWNSDRVIVNGMYEEFAIANLFLRKKSIAKIVGDPI
jgi:hypothetical protein